MKSSSEYAGRSRAKRTFSAAFKAEAVHLMRRRRAQGIPLAQIGRELEVAPALLWEWAKKLDGRGTGPSAGDGTGAPGETLEEEVKRLRREVVTLRQEREFAKKAAAFFLKESL